MRQCLAHPDATAMPCTAPVKGLERKKFVGGLARD